MELALTEDQQLLHETTVRFIETELPMEQVRALHDDPVGYDRAWLREAAQLGWFSLLVPEAEGGGSVSTNGLADAALIAEELGRHVQPGPFVPMNVVAAALATGGTAETKAEWLARIVDGGAVATWAFGSGEGTWDDGAGVQVRADGDGYVVSGTRGFVQDAIGADVALVTATRDGSPVQVVVDLDAAGVSRAPLESLDLSRRFAHLHLHDVRIPGHAVLVPEVGAEHLLALAVALTSAETVGAMDRLFAMTVEYSKDRIAFGRPIGSFQALKHIMADLAMQLEASKAASEAVARAVGEGSADAAEVVSMVAAYIGDASDELAQMALQIHGGIGYTWEHDLHLLMRRIRSNASLYGEPTWHRERLCAQHGLGGR